jgi:hypothetical protein
MTRGPLALGVIVTSLMAAKYSRVQRRLLLLVAGLTLAPGRAPAQTAYSIDFGALTAFSDATILIGFRGAPAAAQAGADIFVATFPDALVQGFFLFLLDADATYGARLGEQVTLFPRFGGTVLAGGGNGGSGAGYGYNLGVGVLGRASPTLGVRIDYTHHRLVGGSGGGTLPFSSITVGIVWMH